MMRVLSLWIKRFQRYSKKMRGTPIYLKPYWYLITQTTLSGCVSFLLMTTLLKKCWPMFFDVWPEHGLLESGWLGVYVAAMLLSSTALWAGMKLMAVVHFKALADRIYHDVCPGMR